MTAKIINLAARRKSAARDDKARRASENAVRYGQTKANRDALEAARARAEALFAAHRRDDRDA